MAGTELLHGGVIENSTRVVKYETHLIYDSEGNVIATEQRPFRFTRVDMIHEILTDTDYDLKVDHSFND